MLQYVDSSALIEAIVASGPSMWALTALSVVTLALILWKVSQLARLGAWTGGGTTRRALEMVAQGKADDAGALLAGRRTLRARIIGHAIAMRTDNSTPETAAREETERFAMGYLERTRSGLRALELIVTIAPLLGLLGTVMGMIEAFQALQTSGANAEPSDLAGGIWEALLTTAYGMGIAIPASIALTWFEGVADRIRHEVEDGATRVFVQAARLAA